MTDMTEAEVWRMAHHAGRIFVEKIRAESPVLAAAVTAYREAMEQVLRETGYDLTLVPQEEPKPTCRKCGGALTTCGECGETTLCGEAHCAEHLPDGGLVSALVPREDA